MTPGRPQVSIVIPALDEARALPATLDAVARQRGEFEIIVVDGGSSDGTPAIASRFPGVRVIAAARGRAVQMNAGAALGRGEWLLFLHADTLLPEGAVPAIARLPNEVAAGGFRHRFSGSDWRLALISRLHNFRARVTRVMYGDQAFFVRRALFEQLGGFPPLAHMEDIAFGERVRTATRPVLLVQSVVTDARKFVTMGVWKSFARVLAILVCRELGRDVPKAFFANVR